MRVERPLSLPWVMADRRRVVQVLVSLLSFAEQYSRESSPIRVGGRIEGFQVFVTVTGEGYGLSDEDQSDLFRKLSEMDDAGTGLGFAWSRAGLTVSRGIVESHGGRLWVESDGPGLGSRYTFTVPVVEGAAVGALSQSDIWGTASAEADCVLVVDDDFESVRYVGETLSKAGYRPLAAAEVGDVLRIIESEKPSLVLLDQVLPGADAMSVMQTISAVSDAPVIFLSEHGRDEVIARAFDLGASDYMVKPFSPNELVARVQSALRRSASPQRRTPADTFVLGDLSISYPERRVEIAGRAVHLTATEYQMLFELSVNPGVVLTYEELLQRVWGRAHTGDLRLVRGVITRLRRKLVDDPISPRYIFTEIRVGYRMARSGSTAD